MSSVTNVRIFNVTGYSYFLMAAPFVWHPILNVKQIIIVPRMNVCVYRTYSLTKYLELVQWILLLIF